jgi:hypothetical protein
MKWARYVTRLEDMRNAYKVSIEKLQRRNHYGDLTMDKRILLKWILNRV